MTLSESKWARHDDSPVATTPRETVNPPNLTKTEVTVSKSAPLVSRWATAAQITNDIPTPPDSAGNKNSKTNVSEKALDSKLASLSLHGHVDSPSGGKALNKNSSKKPSQPRDKEDGAHIKQAKTKKPSSKDNFHHELNAKPVRKFDDNGDHKQKEATHSKNNNVETKKHVDDKTPMTAGARALAMRIGVPDKKDTKSPRQQPHSRTHSQNHNNNHNHKHDFGRQRKAVSPSAPPQRDADDVDETIKAEVQAMFDKMSDKSTSWADIEDWEDV